MYQGGLIILFTVLFSNCVCQLESRYAEDETINVNKPASTRGLFGKNWRRQVFGTTNTKLSEVTNVTAASTNAIGANSNTEISGTREGKCTIISNRFISVHVANWYVLLVFSLFTVVKFANDECATLTSTENGTCFSSSECLARGGVASGSCAGGYGVCCTCLFKLYIYNNNETKSSNFFCSFFYLRPNHVPE